MTEFNGKEHRKKIKRLENLWANLHELEEMCREYGIEDMLQDNGLKVMQQLVYLNMDFLPGREGNDSVSASGTEWEMKSVNILLTKGFSMCRLSLSAKELLSSDALIFLCRNGGETMKYECLKLEERRIIEAMYAEGAKPDEIAKRVGKCRATIYRELERGKTGETDSRFRQGYSAAVAEARVNRSYRNRGRRKAAQ